jgi:hypothetical protein
MSVRFLDGPPEVHAHYAADTYGFLELSDRDGVYGYAAICEHEDCLELHLEVVRWGPRARQALARDLEWLRREARRRGKSRIIGVREEPGAEPDPRWARFTRIYGFTGQRVLQTAWLDV